MDKLKELWATNKVFKYGVVVIGVLFVFAVLSSLGGGA